MFIGEGTWAKRGWKIFPVVGLGVNGGDGEQWMEAGCRDDHLSRWTGCWGKRRTLSLEWFPWPRYRNLTEKEIFERMGKSRMCSVCVNDHFNNLLDARKESSRPLTEKAAAASSRVMAPLWRRSQPLAVPSPHGPLSPGGRKQAPWWRTLPREGRLPQLAWGWKARPQHTPGASPTRINCTLNTEGKRYFYRSTTTDKVWSWVKYSHGF